MPKKRIPRKRNGHRVLRVAVCGCKGMERYHGKLNGKLVKLYGEPFFIRENRVDPRTHDLQLAKPHRRHHVFFDIGDDPGDNGKVWIEVWDFDNKGKPEYQNNPVVWARPPTVQGMLWGIKQVIRGKIPKEELEAWLNRMWPVPKSISNA